MPESVRDLLTPGEVARLFRVDPKTVARWAQSGKLRSIRTPGGHHRFLAADVHALLDGPNGEVGPAGPECYLCHRTDGEIVDRGEPYGQIRYIHAYGQCPIRKLRNNRESAD